MNSSGGPEANIPRKPAQPPHTPRQDPMRHGVEGHKRDDEQFHPDFVDLDSTPLHDGHAVSEEELESTFGGVTPAGERITKVRRRKLHLVSLLVLLGVVLVALLIALLLANHVIKLPTAGAQASATPSSRCPAATLQYPDPASVSVNVFNSTQRAGLAGQVAQQLKDRGFTIGTVDNKEFTTKAPGVVVSGPNGQAGAFALQQNLSGFDYVQDARQDASVDVILADTFGNPADAAAVKKTPGKLTCLPDATVIPTTGAGK